MTGRQDRADTTNPAKPGMDGAALSQALGIDYPVLLEADLAVIETSLRALAQGGFDDPAVWAALYGRLHDVKGQGGSFDYALVTDIAQQACQLLRAINRDFDLRRRASEALLTSLGHQVAALRLIARYRLTGDGGARGAQLLDGLRTNAAGLRQTLGIDAPPEERSDD
ncbi:MAG TPA: hypothetical protein VNT30_08840 [Stellaceae bacterium]|nr:hypothetical protein [Stellaceae bacterium]